ncbi:MAG: universal stress protein [Desulfobulbaceae bacterium]|nr:universal stress protein [Desulfobulbaceae bacterium]
MNEFKRVLVVSRMIQSSGQAIHVGVSLAKKFKAELFVIHSVYNPFSLKGWSMGNLSLKKDYEKVMQNAKQDLSALVKAEKTKGLDIKELVTEGEPTDEILKTIERENIDLLIMPAHTEGHLEDLFFQRSNNELTRKMPCSIILVKQEAVPFEEIGEEEK